MINNCNCFNRYFNLIEKRSSGKISKHPQEGRNKFMFKSFSIYLFEIGTTIHGEYFLGAFETGLVTYIYPQDVLESKVSIH